MVNLNGLALTADECLYNGRVKYYRRSDGTLCPYELMYCNRLIFNPDGVRVSKRTKKIDMWLDYVDTMTDDFESAYISSGVDNSADNLKRAKRRAANKLYDYIMCNDFDMFVTLTLDKSAIDRGDYGAVVTKLNSYLGNRVRRYGLKYVGVVELHKKGGLHFHFLMNGSALKLVDSGTVLIPDHKKPVKVSTAIRYGVHPDKWRTVYNVADWTLGFTTAIGTYGSRGAVASYLTKYITKDMSAKIGGRWYYSGGKLDKPVCLYDRGGFADITNYTYEYQCDGGSFKVCKFDEEGNIINYAKD